MINWEGIARFLGVPVEKVRSMKLKPPTDDFLQEMIDESTAQDLSFPERVAAAVSLREKVRAALEKGRQEREAGAWRIRMKRR